MLAAQLPASAAGRADLCARNRDSIALVIGNRDYEQTIAVPYAVNDARAMRRFLVDRLCYREGNVVVLENATFNHLRNWLGTVDDPHGQLWNWVKPGRSDVVVYYSGHGAPDRSGGSAFIVPVDGNPDKADLGFGLDGLERNLKALKENVLGPDRELVLLLDACFSGKTSNGEPLIKGSFTGWTPKFPTPTSGILRFSAAGPDEIARWDEDAGHGLFTRVFLDAVAGGADRSVAGNHDGLVTGNELVAYLADEVGYAARRRWGADQRPELPASGTLSWAIPVSVAYAAGEAFRDCPTCPEMVAVPAGSYEMGAPDTEPGRHASETPRHKVTIAAPFALSRTEVTVAEFRAFAEATGYQATATCRTFENGRWQDIAASWRDPGFAQGEDEPAVCLALVDVEAYLGWLNDRTGGAYRLPSEAEWDYAARAGTTSAFTWGASESAGCTDANGPDRARARLVPGLAAMDCDDGFARTAPAGRLKPTPSASMIWPAMSGNAPPIAGTRTTAPHPPTAALDPAAATAPAGRCAAAPISSIRVPCAMPPAPPSRTSPPPSMSASVC
ncbi:MAG: SUMF1/EgtB/PvdO family nonheme iron enzyme [Hyphomicrobiales bacterium]